MGYRFTPSGQGLDILVVTKKGIDEGGLPKGVIVPIGYFHIIKHRIKLKTITEEHSVNRYVAKHCDNENVLTHITPSGMVNRFGLFYTKEEMPEGNWCLDVAKGSWVRRKSIGSFDELVQFL